MNALVPISTAPAFTVGDVERVATAIAKGGLFGSKDPYAVLTLCLLAQAEGQHPAVVFRDYHIISGKPAKKAEAMQRDFLTAGGKIEWHTLDDTMADATFSHPTGGSARISWDKKRVEQAQLGGNAMHKKYPRQMLRSRVISEGVRTVFPGATSGLYVPEEVSSFGAPEVSHNAPQAVEDASLTADEQFDNGLEPAPREKLEGKHPSKSKLQAAMREFVENLRTAETSAQVEGLVEMYGEDLAQCRRYLPAWWEGNGTPEGRGVQGNIEDRRAAVATPDEDSQLSIMIRSMRECETKPALAGWMAANEPAVEALEDKDGRSFKTAVELHESGLELVATAAA